MSTMKYLFRLSDGGCAFFPADGRGIDAVYVINCCKPPLDSCIRGNNTVIKVQTHTILSFLFHHSNNLERDFLNTYVHSYWISAFSKKIINSCLSENTNFRH